MSQLAQHRHRVDDIMSRVLGIGGLCLNIALSALKKKKKKLLESACLHMQGRTGSSKCAHCSGNLTFAAGTSKHLDLRKSEAVYSN